ncbi:MAG: porin [Moraxellaceae bacterium]|nr:porin [Moraxellaceae bacterium]
MKKLLLVSAVAALSVTSAYAATGVYGKVGADLRYSEDGNVSLDNNGTRLGVKGATPVTANTNAIYQAELGLTVDPKNGDGTDISIRDTYVGLSNKAAGTVMAGRLTTIDDNVNFTNPSDYWNSGYQASFDGNRVNNAIAYASPNFGGFQGLAMYQVGDSKNGAECKADANPSCTEGGTFGVAGKYETEQFKAGASYIDLKNGGNVVRVSGAVNVVPQVELSAGYQTMDFDTNGKEKENSYIVAAKYDVPNSPAAAYIEYDGVESAGGTKDNDNSIVSLGGTYDFNKAVSGRAYVGFEDPEQGDKSYGIGTGLTYKF